MSSARTLESVEPNDKLDYIPHQNIDVDNIMRDAPGRIILSMPSSATTQIKSAIRAAARCKRKLVPVGQGIKKGVNRVLAWQSPVTSNGIVIPISEEYRLPYEEVVIMATGSQGEETSALAQIANGTHPDVQIMPDDTVLIITTFTPDKIDPVETMANRLINLDAMVTIYHSLPVSPPLSKVTKKRSSRKKTKAKRSYSIPPRKVVRMTYAELRPVLERRATDKTKPNRLSPEGPYGSWGLSIPREER